MRPTCLYIVVACVISGCVSIDVPDRYSAETLDKVEVGATTREDVILLMGLPKHTGRNGQTFFYRWELSGEVGAVTSVPNPLFFVFVYGSVSFESVRVDFDSSGVVSKLTRGEETLSVPFEMVKYIGYTMAFPEEDKEAKRFLSATDACTVYLYVNRIGGNAFTNVKPFFIEIDRQLVGDAGADHWYYRQIVLPGQHAVIVSEGRPKTVARFSSIFVAASVPPAHEVWESLTFDCVAGELYFFEVRFAAISMGPRLRQVGSDEGREAVNKGRLLIAPQ